MSRDCTESTTSKTSSMHIHRELNHVVCRNPLAFILRMRNTHIRQIKRGIYFLGSHRRIRRINHHITAINALDKSLSMNLITLFLYMTEIISLSPLVTKTFLMAMEHNIIFGNATGNILFPAQEYGLGKIGNLTYLLAQVQLLSDGKNGLFAHSIGNDISGTITKDTLTQTVFPIVIMGKTPQTCFNAANDDRDIRP